MRTAARLSEAAMEGKAIINMYGNAARDILRSAAPGGLPLGSALDLAEVEAKY